MGRVIECSHPLVQHKLAILRNVNTGAKDFRELVTEITMLMGYEVTRDLPLEKRTIKTPMGDAEVNMISGKKIGIVPILRAGLGMVDGFLNLIPAAKVGHIGMYRDPETFKPVTYYCKMPEDVTKRQIIVIDPMLATGGSAIDAINELKEMGVKSIKLANIIAAPEGIEAVQKAHPDVDIFVASIDERLNDHKYIIPGLGDAGDRLFGTK
ncbi:uracil phosphoribosyltransferase [uncultured Ezakiella sp.]|uniref:uracil phosphoribosyltransferase n=1 Tax=uncultured Ezakiella sp. TaxID=1637529 RepID=UPI0025FB5FEB|nr:uracil phosphoribosyltransferase [uncultured Ezakiella sp.]